MRDRNRSRNPSNLRGPIWLLALCGASAAFAEAGNGNPGQDPGNQPPPLVCQYEPPSPATCVDQGWVNLCGAAYGSTDPNDAINNPCLVSQANGKSFVQQAQDSYSAGVDAGTTEKVFDTGIDDFVLATPPPNAFPGIALQSGSGASWAYQELVAQANAWKTANVNPFNYIRSTNYPNGVYIPGPQNQINSCENYVYRTFNDVERWIDALNACKNDARCKVNVSLYQYNNNYNSYPPGIARRRLENSDYEYIYDPSDAANRMTQMVLAGEIAQEEADPFDDTWQLTDIPKNAFYAGTRFTMVPAMQSALAARGYGQWGQDLLNEIARGEHLYEAGPQAGTTSNGAYYQSKDGTVHQGFYDEWDFHHYMNGQTQQTTAGETREYRRRADNLAKLFAQLANDMKCLVSDAFQAGGCGAGTPDAFNRVNPGDAQMWDGDPFSERAITEQVAETQLAVPPATKGMVGFGADLQLAGVPASVLQLGQLAAGVQAYSYHGHVPGQVAPNANVFNVLLNPGVSLTAPLTALVSPALADAGSSPATDAGTAVLLPVDGLGQIAQTNSGSITLSPDLILNVAALNSDPTVTTGLSLSGAYNSNTTTQRATAGVPRQTVVAETQRRLAAWTPSIDPSTLTSQPLGTGWLIEQAWETNPPRWDLRSDTPQLDCSAALPDKSREGLKDDLVHTYKMWGSLCRLTNALLQEWSRKQGGRSSCLDRNSQACDWTPQDFVDRFVTRNVGYAAAAKEVEYKYCKRWTGGGKITDVATYTKQDGTQGLLMGVPASERLTLRRFQAFLNAREKEFEKEMQNVPVKDKDTFGTVKMDKSSSGDAKFGGNFNYQLSWTVQAQQYAPGTDRICRMGGEVLAGFGAGATLFGKGFSIVDAKADIQSNLNNTGKASLDAHLDLVGIEIFNETQDLSAEWSDKEGDSEQPQLLSVPFQVGWVTVTVSAGIAYDYGVMLDFKAAPPAKDSCDVNGASLFSASAQFQPYADLGVWVSADVSLAGIFGVGVEVDLTLVGLTLPLNVVLQVGPDPKAPTALAIGFNANLNLDLVTLKGELDFYIEAFWTHVATFKIVGWDGLHATIPIFRTPTVWLDLFKLPSGTILPPESNPNTKAANSNTETL